MATAHTLFVPGVGYRWQVRDGSDVLYESDGGFASEAEAEAVASAELGSDWPGTPADGTWHYIGDTGEPAFQNSWGNVTAGKYELAYRVQQDGEVDLHGQIVGGASGSVVATLDAAKRPVGSAEYIVGSAYDGTDVVAVIVSIGENGAIVPVWSAGFTPDEVTIAGSYYLNPPTAP